MGHGFKVLADRQSRMPCDSNISRLRSITHFVSLQDPRGIIVRATFGALLRKKSDLPINSLRAKTNYSIIADSSRPRQNKVWKLESFNKEQQFRHYSNVTLIYLFSSFSNSPSLPRVVLSFECLTAAKQRHPRVVPHHLLFKKSCFTLGLMNDSWLINNCQAGTWILFVL